jgi:DnaJ homolog subfamily B member 4
MSDDYYAILGLTKNATETQIKKAYKKLAVRYHPDKQNGKSPDDVKKSEDMFKKVSEAYQVLTDPKQRKMYDQFGKDGAPGQRMPSGHQFNNQDAFKIFEQFFPGSGMGGFSSFGPGSFRFSTSTSNEFDDMSSFRAKPMNMNNNRRSQKKRRSSDHTTQYRVNLEDFYNGQTQKIKVDYSVGSSRQSDILELNIQRGWRSGVTLTFNGKASCQEGETQGDLIVELVDKLDSHEKVGEFFIRRISVSPHLYVESSRPDSEKYADLVYTLPITLKEAQKGGKRQISHMDGRMVNVKFGQLEQSTDEIKIKNEGMPIRKKGRIVGNGNLYIRFVIAF